MTYSDLGKFIGIQPGCWRSEFDKIEIVWKEFDDYQQSGCLNAGTK